MRSDMFEVIIERPRRGGGWKRSTGRSNLRPDELPFRESTGRGRGGTKDLNENLAPLRRFLRSSVGRPWNKVFSEISEHVSVGSAVQKHVRDHLRDLIWLNVHWRDGELWAVRRWGGPVQVGQWGREALYVCPKTGLVRHLVRPRRSYVRPEPLVRRIAGRAFLPLHGGWFELTLLPIPKGVSAPRDIVLRAPVTIGSDRLHKFYGRGDVYAATKRQLSSKECASLGLLTRE